jgi:hypothetical protein
MPIGLEEGDAIDRGKLSGIFGGSLEQIAFSLKHLPLSVLSRARPSHDAHVMLRSKGFSDLPPPSLSSLYMQPHAAWSDATVSSGAMGALKLTGPGDREATAAPADAGKPSGVAGRSEKEDKWIVDYAEMTAAVEERMALLSRLHTENFIKAEAEREWEEEKQVHIARSREKLSDQKTNRSIERACTIFLTHACMNVQEFFRGGIAAGTTSSFPKEAGTPAKIINAGGGLGGGKSLVSVIPVAGFSERECAEFHGMAEEVSTTQAVSKCVVVDDVLYCCGNHSCIMPDCEMRLPPVTNFARVCMYTAG